MCLYWLQVLYFIFFFFFFSSRRRHTRFDCDWSSDVCSSDLLAAVVQGKPSNYDSDLFRPIIRAIGEMARKRYGASADDDRAMCVIADHLRAIAFMIAEGDRKSVV